MLSFKAQEFKETTKTRGMKLHKTFQVKSLGREYNTKFVYDLEKNTYNFPESGIVVKEGDQ